MARRLTIDPLEQRTLLAVVSWDGGGDGSSWSDAVNWSGNTLPGANDDVVINVPGTITVQHASGADSIRSLTSQENINLSGGSLTIAANSSVAGTLNNAGILNVQGGTLLLTGTATSSGTIAVASGAALFLDGGATLTGTSQVTGAGTLNIRNSATIDGLWNVTGTTQIDGNGSTEVDFAGTVQSVGTTLFVRTAIANFHNTPITTASLTLGTLNTSATSRITSGPIQATTFDWQFGTVAGTGTVTVSNSLTIASRNVTLDGRTIINQGTANWSESIQSLANIQLANGAAIRNEVGATFDIHTRNISISGNGSFVNAGTIRKLSSLIDNVTVNGMIAVPFNNTGAIDVQNGVLLLTGAATSSGTIAVASGASVFLDGGATLTGTSQVTGAGTMNIRNSATIDGLWNITGRTQVDGNSGAVVDFTGTVQSVGAALFVRTSTANFHDTSITTTSLTLGTLNTSTTSRITSGPIQTSTFDWQFGTVAGTGTVTVSNSLTIASRNVTLDGRTIINQGTANWSESIQSLANIQLVNGAAIRNEVGATFDIHTRNISISGSGSFDNLGTIRKLNSLIDNVTVNGTIAVPFNNTGAIDVQSGVLLLTGAATSSGSIAVASGASVLLDGGATLAGTSQVTGAGTMNIRNSATIDGLWNITGRTQVDGNPGTVVDFTGTVQSVGAALFVRTSSANFHNTPITTTALTLGTLDTTATTRITSGPIQASTFDWQFGTVAGTGSVTVSNSLTIASRNVTLDGRTLINQGTANWSESIPSVASIQLANGATISNEVGATFDIHTRNISISGNGSFVNAGTIRKLNSLIDNVTVNGTIAVPLNNTGAIDVQVGNLIFTGAATSSGTIAVASGASVLLDGGATLTGTSQVTGAGTMNIRNSATIDGLWNITGRTQIDASSGNVVDFTGTVQSVGSTLFLRTAAVNFHNTSLTTTDLTVSTSNVVNGMSLTSGPILASTFNWQGGALRGAGDITISNSLTVDGLDFTLDGRTLVNQGAGAWKESVQNWSNIHLANNASIRNESNATFDVHTRNVSVSGSGSFVNAGNLRKLNSLIDPNNANSTFNVPFTNTGTIDVQVGVLTLANSFTQTAGSTLVNGGQIAAGTLNFSGGELTGSGAFSGNLITTSQVRPGLPIGVLTQFGNLTQNQEGVLSLSIGGTAPGTNADQYRVNGTVTLHGTLDLQFNNGFLPAIGQTIVLLTNDGTDPITGTFDGLTQGQVLMVEGKGYAISYTGDTGNDVTATRVNLPPTVSSIPAVSVLEDAVPVGISLDTYFSDPDTGASSLTYSVVGNTNPTLFSSVSVVNRQLALQFAPDANGSALLTLRATDPGGLSIDGTISIAVGEVNDPPVCGNDELSSIAEDSSPLVISSAMLTANDRTGPTNENSQTLTITSVGNAVGGAVSLNGNNVVFTPSADYNGAASFVYAVQDNGTTNGEGDFKTGSATVSFTITEVNDAPTGVSDPLTSIAEDSGSRTISIASLLGNDLKGPVNEAGQTLSITNVGNAVGGTVSINGSNVVFVPTLNFNGAASLVYTLSDNGTTSGLPDPRTATATVSFTITEVNDAPIALGETEPSLLNTSTLTMPVADLLANDSPGPANESNQTLTLTAVGSPVGGTIAIVGSNIVFTPTANFVGTGSFQYTIRDNGTTAGINDFKTAVATVTIPIFANTTPIIDLNGSAVAGINRPASYTTIGGSVLIASVSGVSPATVLDPDPSGVASATFVLSPTPDGANELLSVDTGGTSLTSNYNPATHTLSLTGVAPASQYQQVLRTIAYTNQSLTPTTTTRTITAVVFDGIVSSSTATTTITYSLPTTPPSVDLDGPVTGNFSYSTTFSKATGPVNIAGSQAEITATRSNFLSSATIALLATPDGVNEILQANTAGTSIVATYNAGTLTLTGIDTLAKYQQVLRTITYNDLAATPNSSSNRVVRVTVNDGTYTSSARDCTIIITAINGAPTVTASTGTTTHIRNSTPGTFVDPAIIVTDDSTSLQRATIRIVDGHIPGQDSLLIVGSSGGLNSATNVTTGNGFNVTTGTLTLVGTTSVANYQTALRNIRFVSTSSTLSARTISFQVTDLSNATNGALTSNTAAKVLSIVGPQIPAGPVNGNTANADQIRTADLRPFVETAIARWSEVGLTQSQLAALGAVEFVVRDLGNTLGLGGGNSIVIDDNAAGRGWFIDPSPQDADEFPVVVAANERVAPAGSTAARGVDLLSVVIHELGHVLGYDDLDARKSPHDVMTEQIGLGTRRLPDTAFDQAAIWWLVASPSSSMPPLRSARDVQAEVFAHWIQ